MNSVLHILRYSLRQCVKTPANTLLCILVLGGSVAIAASMFRLCQIALFSHAPYDKSERIVEVCRINANKDIDTSWFSNSYLALMKEQVVFSDTLVFRSRQALVKTADNGQRVLSSYVGHNLSRFTGVNPVLGRSFDTADAEPGSAPTVLIGEKLWAAAYNSDTSVLGKTLILDGVARTIIGVMPASFDGPAPLSGVQIWMPLNPDTLTANADVLSGVSLLGRIRDDLKPEMAAEQMALASKHVFKTYPYENQRKVSAYLKFINHDFFDEDALLVFKALFGCSVLIMLMACAIVSGLMSTRYASRMQEFAVCLALGASRASLATRIVVEFLVISATSTLLGLLLDHWVAMSFLPRVAEYFNMPDYMMRQPSWPLYAFMVFVLTLTTITSTLLPAVRASKVDIASVMRESTRTGTSLRSARLSNLIVVWQVATAGAILCGGTMMGYIIHNFSAGNAYYDSDKYLCATLSFHPKFHADDATKLNLAVRIMNELGQYPEIEKSGMTDEFLPYDHTQRVWLEGEPYNGIESVPLGAMRVIMPGYFSATDIPLISGREFEKADLASGHGVAIVTDTFAKTMMGTMNAVGKTFSINGNAGYLTVVGVVPDVFGYNGHSLHSPGFFVPYSAVSAQDIQLFARSGGPRQHLKDVFAKAVRDVDGNICVSDVMSISDYRNRYGGGNYLKFIFILFVIFSASALVMSAAGLYGIISSTVGQRRREMGIHLVLGATPEQVVRLVAKTGAVNAAIGFVLAAVGTLVIRSLVIQEFGRFTNTVESWSIYATSALALLAIISVSLLVPAVRAVRAGPFASLREE
jgi:putative ABC transport system permease protein